MRGMNGLDYLILAAIALGAILGSARGILRIAASFIALVAAVYFAAFYYPAAGGYLQRAFSMRPETAAVVGYVAIFLTVMVVVAWAGGKLAALIRAVHMSWADQLGGALVGAVLGALLAGLIVVVAAVTLPADAPALPHPFGQRDQPTGDGGTHDLPERPAHGRESGGGGEVGGRHHARHQRVERGPAEGAQHRGQARDDEEHPEMGVPDAGVLHQHARAGAEPHLGEEHDTPTVPGVGQRAPNDAHEQQRHHLGRAQ